MIDIFIAVGSNIDPERSIPEAVLLVGEELPILAVSPFYLSPAIGRPDDPPFANGVVAAQADLSAKDVKYSILRGVESRLGRSGLRPWPAIRPRVEARLRAMAGVPVSESERRPPG